MFALVQFKGCNAVSICKYNTIKKVNQKSIVRWNGGHYEATILLIDKYELVQDFYNNINKGLPVVLIQNSCEFESEVEPVVLAQN